MDFMALFTMGTGGHYITMLSAECSISTSHDPLPSSCHMHSEKMLWNPSHTAWERAVEHINQLCSILRGEITDLVCQLAKKSGYRNSLNTTSLNGKFSSGPTPLNPSSCLVGKVSGGWGPGSGTCNYPPPRPFSILLKKGNFPLKV